MSWATHDVEPYVIKRHIHWLEDKIGFRISFMAILLGSWGPDLMTKWLVYGIKIGPWDIQADNPAKFHRGWPGVGFTHSLMFGVVVALILYALTRKRGWSKSWAIGLMIGTWAHVLSDTLDTNGVMLFFPFSLDRVHLDVWAYAGEKGRFLDGKAYFSSLGFVWDGFWIAMVLVNYKVLKADYFRSNVVDDPLWGWLGKWIPEHGLLAIYRGAFFFGVCRWTAWLIWVHVLHSDSPFDLTLGGPDWVGPFMSILTVGGSCPCCGGILH